MAQASAEKLEHTETAENEGAVSVPLREKLVESSTSEPPLPKEKGTESSVQSTR